MRLVTGISLFYIWLQALYTNIPSEMNVDDDNLYNGLWVKYTQYTTKCVVSLCINAVYLFLFQISIST